MYKSAQSHGVLCRENALCKSLETKCRETVRQRGLCGGKKGALTWLGARKDLRIHSDAVEKKNLYLHQHAPQHHHPQERQLQSFHPNYFCFFFFFCHCIMDMRDTMNAQFSLLPNAFTFQRQTKKEPVPQFHRLSAEVQQTVKLNYDTKKTWSLRSLNFSSVSMVTSFVSLYIILSRTS